jgi:crotonobetainyl-CoA:carnitine CoA-transferase CaiB-like acyl-CoA transferase
VTSMLSGVRVVSFTHFLQGPSACQMLADLGAEVIKVEPPTGAFERSWSAPDAYLGDTSVFFLIGNRNVRSLALNLRTDEGVRVVRELLASADVLVESFRPGVMDKLGLGYEDLRAENPGLIYCSLSGYGSDGPYRDRPGQDVLLQAMSGIAAATGGADGAPTPAGASLVDQHAAVLGTMGILAALHGRTRTGEGMRVESNLLNAALDLQIEPLGYHLNGFTGTRSTSGISSTYYKAPYGVFKTADGYVCLSLNALATLAKAFEDDWFLEVGEENSYARRDEVGARLADHVRRRPTAEWEKVFSDAKMWFAPVNTYAEVVADPQVLHNESFVSFTHPDAGEVTVLGHPVRYNGTRPGLRSLPPRLGADGPAVLADLGYSPDSVEELVATGVVTVDQR